MVRAFSWAAAFFPEERQPWRDLFGYRLAGEALNHLSVAGPLLGEPAKASMLRRIRFAPSLASPLLETTVNGIAAILMTVAGLALLALSNVPRNTLRHAGPAAIFILLAFSFAFLYALKRALPPLDRILSGSLASGVLREGKDGELVLVSWNIERGVRQAKILQALHGPLAADLYALQEVDLYTRRTGYRNVAEEIARELRMNYVFGIEFEELAQERADMAAFHGQAVLSRFPVSQARVLRFRHQSYNWRHRWMPRWAWLQPRRGGRMALVVEVQLGGQTWVIYNTHLESKADDADRVLQMREILEDIQVRYSADTPVIVAGDLNTHEGADSPVLRELKARGFQDVLQECKGALQTKPRLKERIDWVFLRHLNSREAGIPKVTISDHYPLVVRIGVP